MSERRQSPRFPCRVHVRVDDEPLPVVLTSRDVSRGGVFLFSPRPHTLDTEVDLELSAGAAHVRAHGRVVHHLPEVGFGVQFLVMSDADQRRLGAFLAELEAAGAIPDGPTTLA